MLTCHSGLKLQTLIPGSKIYRYNTRNNVENENRISERKNSFLF